MTALLVFISPALEYYISVSVVDSLVTGDGLEKDLNKSAKLVAYSCTPSYTAGLLEFIKIFGGSLKFAAWMYSIYTMHLGAGPLKKTPEEKKYFLLLAFLFMIGVTIVISAILGAILFASIGFGNIRSMGALRQQ